MQVRWTAAGKVLYSPVVCLDVVVLNGDDDETGEKSYATTVSG